MARSKYKQQKRGLNMFGDKFNFGNLLKGAKKIQELMEQTQEDLAKIEIIGEAGAGAVKVMMNARHYTQKVTIDDTLMQESKEILEDLIAAAINNATQKIESITKSKMMDASKMFTGLADDEKSTD
jgi:DNA-binding YbaB/EbfC family protein